MCGTDDEYVHIEVSRIFLPFTEKRKKRKEKKNLLDRLSGDFHKDTMNTVNNPASKLDDGNFQLNYIQEPDQITQNKYIVIYPYP